MTKENIEDYRKIVLPFVKKKLLEINYENLGEPDAEEFEKDFNEILDMAIEALEQEQKLIDPAYEKTLNKWIGAEVLDRIRNEMHATAEKHEDGVYYLRDEWVDEIIDKYIIENEV